MLFLSVGAVENSTGSRDIEDMHGLSVKLPELALIMTIGIAGMFLAPFGMLISKWAALKSFIDSGSMLLVLFLIFGSASTLFYWTKWLGKLTAVLHASERRPNTVKGGQWFSMITHAVLMVLLVLAFPFVSQYLIEPFLKDMFRIDIPPVISSGNTNIMIIMMCMIAILPFALRVLAFNKSNKIVTSYMSGANVGDDRNFFDSHGEKKAMYLSNWYMENYFGEARVLKPTILISAVGIAFFVAIVAGGVLL
jgi:ech hydrogenase subunit A